MDIETDTSWYIYGNQKMATRSILKAVSVWRLLIRSHIFSIYGVKGSIIEIRKPKLYPLPRKKNPSTYDKSWMEKAQIFIFK